MSKRIHNSTVSAGVVGVGNMGRHHARVYRELPRASLVGVADADPDRAEDVATTYGTNAYALDDLLDAVDVVSIAVPTRYHFEIARKALSRDVHVLVEKPFVEDPDDGRHLAGMADRRDLVLQVGHVERFNPAVRAMADIVPEYDLIALEARRLGPPTDREAQEGVALDLMIHDLDVMLSVVGSDPTVVGATGTRDNHYVTAQLEFDEGVVAHLTASRLTQRRVRELELTTTECQILVDYIDQSVRIHRRSLPEYVETNGGIRYRNESVVEHPTVDNGEPLRKELEAFVGAVLDGEPPVVSAEDGLRALELARRIDQRATTRALEVDTS